MANASQAAAGLGLAAALADISCEGRGPSEGCLRAEEVPSSEQSEIVQLRRTSRRLEMENEILRRAACFTKDALPK